jgi:hypothetical protein
MKPKTIRQSFKERREAARRVRPVECFPRSHDRSIAGTMQAVAEAKESEAAVDLTPMAPRDTLDFSDVRLKALGACVLRMDILADGSLVGGLRRRRRWPRLSTALYSPH